MLVFISSDGLYFRVSFHNRHGVHFLSKIPIFYSSFLLILNKVVKVTPYFVIINPHDSPTNPLFTLRHVRIQRRLFRHGPPPCQSLSKAGYSASPDTLSTR